MRSHHILALLWGWNCLGSRDWLCRDGGNVGMRGHVPSAGLNYSFLID